MKGEKRVITDTLSRAYVNVTDPAENRLNVFSAKRKENLQVSRLKKIKYATDQDPDLQELIEKIQFK